MRFFYAFTVVLFSTLSFSQAASPSAPPKELPKLERFRAELADPAVDPCTDFYKYTCGKWHRENPMPSDQVFWGPAGPLNLWSQTLLVQTLEKLSANDPKRTANEQKIGDYYHACMDEKTVEAHAREWLKPELERIAKVRSQRDLIAAIAYQHQTLPAAWAQQDNQTNSTLFGFTGWPDYADASHNVAFLDQGGMSLPGRSYCLDQDEKSKDIRSKFVKHISNLFVLAGAAQQQADADAQVVLALETDLAKAAMDAISRRDPNNTNNKMTLAQVKALAPSLDFDQYLKLVNAPASPHYIVTSPNFFKGVETMLHQHPLEHWKVYLRSRMLQGSGNLMSADFVNENFDFVRTLIGAKENQPRWRRCVNSVDGNLGEALGQAYVAAAFPPENKARVLKMVEDLENALDKDIAGLEWMTPETKKQAKVKLQATLNKIGYPDSWRDYSAIPISRDNYLANRQNAIRFEFARNLAKIGKPVDRNEWTMTPPTINAYEEPTNNTINFPAGILQPPYFDMQQDDSVNYGDIGGVIGHEIIHGFDDQGRKFDAQGNLRDWWTASDTKEYDVRGKCISDQYTQEIPEAGPGVKQDGRMTQGEDTADNGGLRIAFQALQQSLTREGREMDTKESDGLTPRQRFFMSYSFGWCSEYRPELIRLVVLTDPHSYPKYRVNNTVANMPEFAAAWGCQKGQKMARVNACRVW